CSGRTYDAAMRRPISLISSPMIRAARSAADIPALRNAATCEPAEVPMMTSAVRGSQPVASARPASSPEWNATPTGPPAPSTRPSRCRGAAASAGISCLLISFMGLTISIQISMTILMRLVDARVAFAVMTHPATILVTSSRMPFALDEVRKLGEAGHHVIAADTFRSAPGSHSKHTDLHFEVHSPRYETLRFVDDIAEIVVRQGVDLVLPTFEQVFYLAAHRDRLDAPVFCDSLDVLAGLHDKVRFLEQATDAS